MKIDEAIIRDVQEGRLSVPKEATYDDIWRLLVVPEWMNRWSAYSVRNNDAAWRLTLRPLIGDEQVRNTTWRTAKTTLMMIPSDSTRCSAAKLWSKMCNLAIREGVIESNPIKRPYMQLPSPEPRPKPLLGIGELAAWMEMIAGFRFAPYMHAQVGGGMRKEEACALDCEDVTRLEHKGRTYALAVIGKTLAYPNRKVLQNRCKTPASVRTAVIGEPFATPLLACAEAGHGPLVPDLRCGEIAPPYTERHYASPGAYTTAVKELFRCSPDDVTHVPPMYLRHTWSTWQAEAGSPSALVEKAMGHTGTTMRDEHYVVSSVDSGILLADNLTRYIYASNPSLAPTLPPGRRVLRRLGSWLMGVAVSDARN